MALVVVAELDRDAVRYGVVGVVGDAVAVVDPHVAPRAAVGRLHPVGGASVGEEVAELPDRLVGGDLAVGFGLTCDRGGAGPRALARGSGHVLPRAGDPPRVDVAEKPER